MPAWELAGPTMHDMVGAMHDTVGAMHEMLGAMHDMVGAMHDTYKFICRQAGRCLAASTPVCQAPPLARASCAS